MAANSNKSIPASARYLLGIIFLFFGLNYFFQFLPSPTPEIDSPAALFSGTGSIWLFLHISEIAGNSNWNITHSKCIYSVNRSYPSRYQHTHSTLSPVSCTGSNNYTSNNNFAAEHISYMALPAFILSLTT